LKIGFIVNIGFPTGGATTNRVYTLAKGLWNEKNNVKVYCLRPTESAEMLLNENNAGFYDGIEYLYTSKSIIRSKYKLCRALNVIRGNVGFFFSFIKNSRTEKFDFLISSTSDYISNGVISIICRWYKTKFVLAVDEFPHVVRTPERYPNWFRTLYLGSFFRLFDGLIVMTSVLEDYYKPFCNKTAQLIHIPMTVEMERFEGKKEIPPLVANTKYFAYCGSMGQNNKDGIPILIKAFHKVLKKNICENLKLVLIGTSSPFELDKLKSIIVDLQMEDSVIFTGKVHKDIIPDYICNAMALCLSRPDNIQAQGGFPTKLGEYLATGRPVVVTDVGEISKYLNDQSAYISKPDSIDDFGEKMVQVLTDPNSISIGQKGKKVAEEHFCYKKQGKILSDFLRSMQKLS